MLTRNPEAAVGRPVESTAKSSPSLSLFNYLQSVRNYQPFISYQRRVTTDNLTLSNLLSAWDGDDHTGLMQRCREAWDTPLESLNDLMVATFLNQNIVTKHLLIEAQRRLKEQERDGTEYFDGQLLEAIERVQPGE